MPLLLRRELLVVWPSPVPSLPQFMTSRELGGAEFRCGLPALMLVAMKWLFEEFAIDGRFCISIHDEFATWCGRRTDTAQPSPCKSPTS